MTPVVRGLYLAGRVDTDPVTRNLTLVNCFRALRLPTAPGVATPFYLVAYLVNGLGDVRLEARFTASTPSTKCTGRVWPFAFPAG